MPSNTTTDQPTLAVTQADIDAANALDDALGFLTDLERPIVLQAFARHRTNSEPRPAGDLREAVERGAHALHEAEDSWNDYDWEYLPDTVKDSFRDQASHVIRALATHSPAPMAGEGAPDEDWLTDVIDNSLDMDWTGRVGAKAIIAAWGTRHD